MRKDDCMKWAEALINGKFLKYKGAMSDSHYRDEVPNRCCCLGVLNEALKPENYESNRLETVAEECWKYGMIKTEDPVIFGIRAAYLNDGFDHSHCTIAKRRVTSRSLGIDKDEGMTHEEIGTLLLFAIESGEFRTI
jgi:hypothetical protein